MEFKVGDKLRYKGAKSCYYTKGRVYELQEKYGDKVPANQCLKVMQEFHKITTQHYNDALQLVRELRAHGVNAKLNSQDSTIIIYHC